MKQFVGIALFLFVVIPFFAVSLKLLTVDPPVFPDEAYLYTTTHQLMTSGRLATPIYKDTAPGRPDIRAYSYPPLYFYLQRLWLSINDDVLLSIRLLSLSTAIAVITCWYILLQRLTKNQLVSTGGTVLLYLSTPFGMAARVARMEIQVLLFLVAMILFWILWRARNKRLWLILASVASGLAILTHPWGSVVPLLLCILILGDIDNLKQKLRYLVIGLIPIVFSYLLWISSVRDRLDLFFQQLNIGVLYKTQRTPLVFLLVQNDPFWAALLTLYGVSIVIGMFIARKTHNHLVGSLSICAAVVLGAVTLTQEQWYLVYLPIFPLLLFLLFLADEIKKKQKVTSLLYAVILMAIGFLQVKILLPGLSAELSQPPSYELFAQEINKAIPLGSHVLLSSLPDPYFALQSRIDLTVYAVPHVAIPDAFSTLLNHTDIVVVNFVTNKQLGEYIQEHGDTVVNVDVGGYKASVVSLQR